MFNRGALNPKKGAGNDIFQKEVLDTKKFLAPKHELDLEKVLEMITPRDHVKKEAISNFYTNKITRLGKEWASTTDPAKRKDFEAKIAALNMWKEQGVEKAAEGEVNKAFRLDFYKWLNGHGEEEDHQKTPWNRQRIPDAEIQAYLKSFTDARYDFIAKLEQLIYKAAPGGRGLEGINEHYLYFKYVIRGGWQNCDEAEFLKDYDRAMAPNHLMHNPYPYKPKIHTTKEIMEHKDFKKDKDCFPKKQISWETSTSSSEGWMMDEEIGGDGGAGGDYLAPSDIKVNKKGKAKAGKIRNTGKQDPNDGELSQFILEADSRRTEREEQRSKALEDSINRQTEIQQATLEQLKILTSELKKPNEPSPQMAAMETGLIGMGQQLQGDIQDLKQSIAKPESPEPTADIVNKPRDDHEEYKKLMVEHHERSLKLQSEMGASVKGLAEESAQTRQEIRNLSDNLARMKVELTTDQIELFKQGDATTLMQGWMDTLSDGLKGNTNELKDMIEKQGQQFVTALAMTKGQEEVEQGSVADSVTTRQNELMDRMANILEIQQQQGKQPVIQALPDIEEVKAQQELMLQQLRSQQNTMEKLASHIGDYVAKPASPQPLSEEGLKQMAESIAGSVTAAMEKFIPPEPQPSPPGQAIPTAVVNVEVPQDLLGSIRDLGKHVTNLAGMQQTQTLAQNAKFEEVVEYLKHLPGANVGKLEESINVMSHKLKESLDRPDASTALAHSLDNLNATLQAEKKPVEVKVDTSGFEKILADMREDNAALRKTTEKSLSRLKNQKLPRLRPTPLMRQPPVVSDTVIAAEEAHLPIPQTTALVTKVEEVINRPTMENIPELQKIAQELQPQVPDATDPEPEVASVSMASHLGNVLGHVGQAVTGAVVSLAVGSGNAIKATAAGVRQYGRKEIKVDTAELAEKLENAMEAEPAILKRPREEEEEQPAKKARTEGPSLYRRISNLVHQDMQDGYVPFAQIPSALRALTSRLTGSSTIEPVESEHISAQATTAYLETSKETLKKAIAAKGRERDLMRREEETALQKFELETKYKVMKKMEEDLKRIELLQAIPPETLQDPGVMQILSADKFVDNLEANKKQPRAHTRAAQRLVSDLRDRLESREDRFMRKILNSLEDSGKESKYTPKNVEPTISQAESFGFEEPKPLSLGPEVPTYEFGSNKPVTKAEAEERMDKGKEKDKGPKAVAKIQKAKRLNVPSQLTGKGGRRVVM